MSIGLKNNNKVTEEAMSEEEEDNTETVKKPANLRKTRVQRNKEKVEKIKVIFNVLFVH